MIGLRMKGSDDAAQPAAAAAVRLSPSTLTSSSPRPPDSGAVSPLLASLEIDQPLPTEAAAAASSPSSALSSARPPLLSVPFDSSRVLSVSERVPRSPKAGRKRSGLSPVAQQLTADSSGEQQYTGHEKVDSSESGSAAEKLKVQQEMEKQWEAESHQAVGQSAAVKLEHGQTGAAAAAAAAAEASLLEGGSELGRGRLRTMLRDREVRRRSAGQKEEQRPADGAQPRPAEAAAAVSAAAASASAAASAAGSPAADSASGSRSSGGRQSLSRLFSQSSTSNLFGSISRRSSSLFSSQPRSALSTAESEDREWLHRRMTHKDDDDKKTGSQSSADGGAAGALSPLASPLANPLLPLHTRLFAFCRLRLFPPLLVLLVLIQLIVLPVRLALPLPFDPAQAAAAWLDEDRLMDALYVLGVLISDYVEISMAQQQTAQQQQQQQPSSTAAASSRFSVSLRPLSAAQRRMLVLDILSTLPYWLMVPSSALVGLFTDPAFATPLRIRSLLHLPRLLRLPRLSSFMEQVELSNLVNSWVPPTSFRLLSFAVWIFLFAHLTGCCWLLVGYVEGLPDDNDWVVEPRLRTASLHNLYLHALYTGFCSMTGNAPVPSSSLEHLFSLSALLVGVSIYGLLIGNLTAIIQQLNSRSDAFRSKMAELTALMQSYRLPLDVQVRVRSCMQYLHGYGEKAGEEREERHRGKEGWDVLNHLPAYLRNEVLVYVNGDIVSKVPLFRDCSDGFMRSLVPLLVPEVVIPGDLLIREGEIGREMYLLRRGELEIIAHGQTVATLTSGGFVGEVCLLWEGTKRTATVRAVTFCDVLVLAKEDFDSVLQQYPDVQRRMKMEATMRKNARSLQDRQLAGGAQQADSAQADRRDKGEAGDRLRRLVREGSLQAALLRQDSHSSTAAGSPFSSRPSTPPSASSSASTFFTEASPASSSAASQSPVLSSAPVTPAHARAPLRRAGSLVLPTVLDVLSSVRARGEERAGGLGQDTDGTRRQTMPSVNGAGELQHGPDSVARQKWRKLKQLTKPG